MAEPLDLNRLHELHFNANGLTLTQQSELLAECRRLRSEIEQRDEMIGEYREALSEISEGKGRFSRDPLTHAGNCISDMKELALRALAAEPRTEGSGEGEKND